MKTKKHVNKFAKEIKGKIKDHNNNEFSKFIEALSAHENPNYSLWKATNKIKEPMKPIAAIRNADNTRMGQKRGRASCRIHSNHLCNTFTPYNINNSKTKCHCDEDAQNTSSSTSTVPYLIQWFKK